MWQCRFSSSLARCSRVVAGPGGAEHTRRWASGPAWRDAGCVVLAVEAWDRRVVRRSSGFGEAPEGYGSGDFGGFGADPGVEVFAAEPVAVAFEARGSRSGG